MSKNRMVNIFTDNFYNKYLYKLETSHNYINKLLNSKDLSATYKFNLIKNILSKELWEIYELGDHRTRLRVRNDDELSPQDSFSTPYGTTLFPHPSELFIYGLTDLKSLQKKGLDKSIQKLKLKEDQLNKSHIEMNSCTGSSPDIKSYQYGIILKNQLKKSKNYKDFKKICTNWKKAIRKNIKKVYKLPSTTNIIFSLSGTDAELILPLFGVNKNYITKETGTGTEYSAQALHSSNITWYGEKIKKGELIDKELVLETPEIFPIRKSNEKVLTTIEHYNAKLKHLEREKLTTSKKIIGLHITTHTKTGVGTLNLEQALAIRKKFGFEKIILFADAAQTHLTRKEIVNLIKHDIIVSITGSKRPGGPMFTNAILLSKKMAKILIKKTKEIGYVYKGYSRYFVKSDFNSVLDEKYLKYLSEIPNFSQLIKWKVSLDIISRFYSCKEKKLMKIEQYLQYLIKRKLKDSKYFELTKSSNRLKKYAKSMKNKKINHIIPFHARVNGKYLNREELERFQYLMNHDLSKIIDNKSKYTKQEREVSSITGLFGQRVQEGKEPASMRICPSMNFFNSIFVQTKDSYDYKKITKSIYTDTIEKLIDKATVILKSL